MLQSYIKNIIMPDHITYSFKKKKKSITWKHVKIMVALAMTHVVKVCNYYVCTHLSVFFLCLCVCVF
jgi:hypothetical protein